MIRRLKGRLNVDSIPSAVLFPLKQASSQSHGWPCWVLPHSLQVRSVKALSPTISTQLVSMPTLLLQIWEHAGKRCCCAENHWRTFVGADLVRKLYWLSFLMKLLSVLVSGYQLLRWGMSSMWGRVVINVFRLHLDTIYSSRESERNWSSKVLMYWKRIFRWPVSLLVVPSSHEDQSFEAALENNYERIRAWRSAMIAVPLLYSRGGASEQLFFNCIYLIAEHWGCSFSWFYL